MLIPPLMSMRGGCNGLTPRLSEYESPSDRTLDEALECLRRLEILSGCGFGAYGSDSPILSTSMRRRRADSMSAADALDASNEPFLVLILVTLADATMVNSCVAERCAGASARASASASASAR